MNELYVSEDYICIDGEKRFSGGGIDQPYLTKFDSVGDLYRACRKQYGRCLSRMYVGEDKPKQIGWVFFRKATNKDHYDMEVWITVYTTPPTKQFCWTGAEYPSFKKA